MPQVLKERVNFTFDAAHHVRAAAQHVSASSVRRCSHRRVQTGALSQNRLCKNEEELIDLSTLSNIQAAIYFSQEDPLTENYPFPVFSAFDKRGMTFAFHLLKEAARFERTF